MVIGNVCVFCLGRSWSCLDVRKSLDTLILHDFGTNQALRHSRVGASDSDGVDLSVEKENFPVYRITVDTSFVCGVHDIEVVENLVDAPASGCPYKERW